MDGFSTAAASEWAIHRAAELGNIERLKALFLEYNNLKASGVEPTIKGINEQEPKRLRTALMMASFNGHVPVVEFLIRSGASCNIQDKDGRTALMISMRLHNKASNHMDVIRPLIENSDCNIKDNMGRVALVYAAKIGCKRAVEGTLAKTDKSPEIISDNYGISAAMAAAARGNVEVLMELYRNDVDIDAKDKTNTTALMYAALAGKSGTVHRLIELGADIGLADWNGRTALMLASAKGHVDIVRMLIGNKACDADHMDNNGLTALVVAASNGHLDVVKLLLRYHPRTTLEAKRKAIEFAKLNYHEHVEAILNASLKTESNQEEQNGQFLLHNSSRGWLLKWPRSYFKTSLDASGTTAIRNQLYESQLQGQENLHEILEGTTGGITAPKRMKMFDPECVFDPDSSRVKEEILIMIGLYLQKEGYDSTSMTLQDEANIRLREGEILRQSAKRVYESIINGEWDGVKKLINKQMLGKNYRKFLYSLYKQEYLEMVSRGEDSRAFDFLQKRLKPMEAQGKEEFPHLCYLLSCKSVTDAPIFRGWDKVSAREELAETFNTMFSLVLDSVTFSSLHHKQEDVDAERLVHLLQQAITYQIEFSEYQGRSGVTPQVQTLFQDFQSVGVPNRLHSYFVGHKYNVKCVEFVGDDGLLLASGSSDRSILLWRTKENNSNGFDSEEEDEQYNENFMDSEEKAVTPECIIIGHNSRVWDLSSDRSGDWLASGAGDGTVRLWNVQSCLREREKQIRQFSLDPTSENSLMPLYSQNVKFEDIKTQHEGDVYSLQFHHDQMHLLTTGYDKTARLTDLTTNKLVKSFVGHSGAVTHAIFNPLGNLVISGSKDCTIRFWDLLSGVCVRSFVQPTGEITSLDIGKSGNYILSASKDGSNRIWDLRMGKNIKRLRGHQNTSRNFIRAIYGPMDALVIGGSEDSRVYIWDTQTGDLLQRLRGHSGPVFQTKWNETTSLVASCSDDGTIMTWAYR